MSRRSIVRKPYLVSAYRRIDISTFQTRQIRISPRLRTQNPDIQYRNRQLKQKRRYDQIGYEQRKEELKAF